MLLVYSNAYSKAHRLISMINGGSGNDVDRDEFNTDDPNFGLHRISSNSFREHRSINIGASRTACELVSSGPNLSSATLSNQIYRDDLASYPFH